MRCKKLKKNRASQECISLTCSLFELLRFSASEDREHFEALRTFRARWARSENHCVLQRFSTFRDGFAAQYKVKRGSKVFAKQNSPYVSSEAGFEAYYFEASFARLQRNGVPRSLDVIRIVHACSETGFELFYVDNFCMYLQ